jgi:hypothetical protein
MHPDIKKFWEDAGYSVGRSATMKGPASDAKYYWYVDRADLMIHTMIAITLHNGNSSYYMNLHTSDKVPEEMALRMIRLKSFL